MSKFPNSPGIRWMVFADVWMFICPLQVMCLQCRSHDSSCSHMIGNLGPIRSHDQEDRVLGYWPWIPVQNHKVKIKMANDVSLSFSEFITNITGLCCNYVPRCVLKLNLWIFTPYMKVTRLHSEYNYSILLLKWLPPSNGGSVFSLF